MPQRILTATRTAMAQAIIAALGSGAKIELWSGAMPAGLGAPSGAKLATGTFGATIGTASAGRLDIDEAGITQDNSLHVNGTPTFARLTSSGGTVHYDISIGAAPEEWAFSGTVALGQNVTFSGLFLTMPAATS
jgi:hypothetical protein